MYHVSEMLILKGMNFAFHCIIGYQNVSTNKLKGAI